MKPKLSLLLTIGFLGLNITPCLAQTHFPTTISVAYWGEKGTHPGLELSLGYDQKSWPLGSQGQQDIGFAMALGSYLHFRNHWGIRLTPRAYYIITGGKGFQLGLSADLGYFRRFYAGPTFQITDQGRFESRPLSGQHALTFGTAISLGHSWYHSGQAPYSWFARIGAFWEFPLNGFILMHPYLSLGINKHLEP